VRITVVIAEDHPLSREGIRQLLEMEEDIDVVGEASDGMELLSLLERLRPEPDVALVDARMPRMDGLEATKRIRVRFPNVRVLILSAFDDRALVISAVEAGARGYVLKDRDTGDLVKAVRLVISGQFVVDPHLTTRRVRPVERAGAANEKGLRRDGRTHSGFRDRRPRPD
jgi:DNA-binding NarL/FixJ family response regulator